MIDGDATDSNIVKIGDKVTATGVAGTVHALVTKINPDNDNTNEIEISVTDSIGDGAAITFVPPFFNVTPHYTDSNTGSAVVGFVSGSSGKYEFSVTIRPEDGRALTIQRQPTVEDLCFVTEVTFEAAALPIQNEDVSASTFKRWPILNAANISEGNILDPRRAANPITPAVIRSYRTTKTLTEISNENRYYTDFNQYEVEDVSISGVDSAGSTATAVDRNGRVTARKGNITFDVSQPDALKSDSGIRIIAQGAKAIKQATGMGVSLTVNDIEPTTPVSAITSSASSASTTLPITEGKFIVVGATIRGLGIDPAVANPTVVSKSGASGALNVVASSAQTLEDDTTLFFDGYYPAVTITGTIEMTNAPIADTTIYFRKVLRMSISKKIAETVIINNK